MNKIKFVENPGVRIYFRFLFYRKIPPFDKKQPNNLWQALPSDGTIVYYHITDSPKMEPISQEFQRRVDFWNSINLLEYQVTLQDRKDEL